MLYRISLTSFILALVATVIIPVTCSTMPHRVMAELSRVPWLVILDFVAAGVLVAVSIVTGLAIAWRRPVVLLWVLPCTCWLLWLVIGSIYALMGG